MKSKLMWNQQYLSKKSWS